MAKGSELQRAGRAVAARRGELGMTQQELAAAAGVDLKTVYNLESGTRWPIARTRVAVSAALGWAADALTEIAASAEPAAAGARNLPPAAAPDLGAADVIPAMSPKMRAAAQRHYDEIAGALGVASAVLDTPPESLRGEQVFGQGTELARLWDHATDAGLALFPGTGYPVRARAWMCAIALVRRDERRTRDEAASLARAQSALNRRPPDGNDSVNPRRELLA